MIKELKEYIKISKEIDILKQDIININKKKDNFKTNCYKNNDLNQLNYENIILEFNIKKYSDYIDEIKKNRKKLQTTLLFISILTFIAIALLLLTDLTILSISNIILGFALNSISYNNYLKKTKEARKYLKENDINDLKNRKNKIEKEIEKQKIAIKSINRRLRKYEQETVIIQSKLKRKESTINKIINNLVNNSLEYGIHEKLNSDMNYKKLVIKL